MDASPAQDPLLRSLSVHSWVSYKRLEAGVFKLPRLDAGTRSVELRASELAMILDGIDMSKLKRVPRYERSAGTNRINPQRVIG
jgi:transposase